MTSPKKSFVCKCGAFVASGRGQCKECRNAYERGRRAASPDVRLASNARAYANVYQRRGKLKPKPCERCGAPAQKHHPDYSEPLVVEWLCPFCHRQLHREQREAERELGDFARSFLQRMGET